MTTDSTSSYCWISKLSPSFPSSSVPTKTDIQIWLRLVRF